ncbi:MULTISPECIES: ligase-associated DNA damage response DEXH box helicase [unclassified Mesorhizobium]|uniref:ligase-associated DNA damage response DEXH box helicase n=1 Tax=unclassified Mesorhizobium TaxID=325217 RepID=UPI00112CE9D6|nr:MULTISPECIES: ligase-associated DNA damage response DEXH box helicase [unclassified Mesorhizobium]TPI52865.1 ligase-associated DNA damage response DEXH box helicase [Mesorhizobium sp. B3-1-1]TPJ70891.1 ligase-associated DNA damage response DEXH box helicase [Mesorhizobium sp. B2-6-7]TPJ85924.1 ligase-associated DNA damage response DEXH box helicase [Mesorhizobium sp. B2-6-3]TPJ99792.1 ligase-associated DNA damage response DEXH box helicase [Mesorhizobium sp. B2-5-10]TPK07631.1 ligase-associ
MTEKPRLADQNAAVVLPEPFLRWFGEKGWSPRAHQIELLARAQAGQSVLLIAPTGAGKTLAGFLPSLTELAVRARRKPGQARRGIHTLYISPLKALAVDIERNLGKPVEEIGLSLTIETRTGDTPAHKRQRQKLVPPDILLTTPEQLALLIAAPDARRFFEDLRYVVLDELHSLVISKRGHLLALGLARLRQFMPELQTIGLSATVAEPDELRRWLVGQNPPKNTASPEMAELIVVTGGAKPEISILDSEERVPWAGHSARYATPEIYREIKRHKTTLLFVNTRSQAELLFQELWRVNEDTLPIALHHGSLDVAQRRRVEKAMGDNALRAIVATSTLDLGIDWGDVDLVVHVGAPKGASRLAQRIGRANHRMDEPSKAILIPANRFEVLECRAALDANYLGAQDTPPLVDGGLDVLAQHVLGCACGAPFRADDLYEEVRSAAPYAGLGRPTFDRVVDFVATGGYALKSYERYARIRLNKEGLWRVSNPRVAQQYRLNVGTIIEVPALNVRYVQAGSKGSVSRGGRVLGKIEEAFLETLTHGDTFMFAGKVLRFEGIRENECFVSNAPGSDAKVPYYGGGKFPLSTYLAEQVRAMLDDPQRWKKLPEQVADWLRFQADKSVLPKRDDLLIETFPRGNRHYLVAYPFEGRLAHQTLGMLLTRRLDRTGARPLGFVATDYALAIWSLGDMGAMFKAGKPSLGALFDEDMLGDDLEAWLADSWLLKRTFRNCALISGLIEKRHPGKEKSGRQVTVSTDLIYDVLRSHEPDHILLQATRADAAAGLLDVSRLADMLSRIQGRIMHKNLEQISPLAVPIMLEIGKMPVHGEADETLLMDAATLVEEAMGPEMAEE